MTITIFEGYTPDYVLFGAKDDRFHKAFGNIVRAPVTQIYQNMAEITAWANNELGEEVLFEID